MTKSIDFDSDLVGILVKFIQRERARLVAEWIEAYKKIDNVRYTSLPNEDVEAGSEHFLDTIAALMTEPDNERAITLMESSIRNVVRKRIGQGVDLEYLLVGSLLHRDILVKALETSADFQNLSTEDKLAIVTIVYHYCDMLHNGVAKLAHEASVSEIDRLKRFNESIVTSVTEGIIIEDQNGIISYANPKFLDMIGQIKTAIIGEHWERLVPKDQLKRFREEASKRSLGMDGKFEGTLLTKDERSLPVLISARPIFESGRFKGVLSVVTDITEVKRIREELERSKKEMERLNVELQGQARALEADNVKLRTLLNIEPVKETQVSGEGAYALDPGYIHMFLSQETDTSFRVFQDLVKHGLQGLCVSRVLPDTIRKTYSLEKTPIIWLTTNKVQGLHCVTPVNIVDLSTAIINFMERTQNGVVLLEGMEYLISQNNFRSILNLVQLLNDKIMLNQSRIIVPLDPEVLDPKDFHQLKKEVRVFEDKRTRDLRRMPAPHV